MDMEINAIGEHLATNDNVQEHCQHQVKPVSVKRALVNKFCVVDLFKFHCRAPFVCEDDMVSSMWRQPPRNELRNIHQLRRRPIHLAQRIALPHLFDGYDDFHNELLWRPFLI